MAWWVSRSLASRIRRCASVWVCRVRCATQFAVEVAPCSGPTCSWPAWANTADRHFRVHEGPVHRRIHCQNQSMAAPDISTHLPALEDDLAAYEKTQGSLHFSADEGLRWSRT